MPIRVELIDEAVEDLARYAETGNLPLFLKKLLRLEEVGKAESRQEDKEAEEIEFPIESL